MVWVGWSLDSRLSRPGRHIGASHSKRSRARQVKVKSGSGSGQVGKEGHRTGPDRTGRTGQARLIGRNRKVAKQVCCYLRSASTIAPGANASARASACASACASASASGASANACASASACNKCSQMGCCAVQCGTVQTVQCGLQASREDRQRQRGVGRRRERELGVDKGLAWALSFFACQFEE